MRRRRLRLNSFSDDEEERNEVPRAHEQQPPLPPPQQEGDALKLEEPTGIPEALVLNSCNPNPSAVIQLDTSDDDFVDVAENLSTPSPPERTSDQSFPAPPVTVPNVVNGNEERSGYPINDSLQRLGLRLRREWLESCIRGLENCIHDFSSFDVTAQAKLCFEQFLFSDMNYTGAGVLPENVGSMHLVDLAGPVVLQVDEVVNISCPLRGRYQNSSAGIKRCLKLSMTDGVQRVFGMEYRPIKDLDVLAPAGMKVVICNVHIRRGLLMLVPEVFEVLGGLVEELEAARERLVQEVNRPPRGKRSRTGVVPPLSSRATHAAWPSNGVTDPGHVSVAEHQGTYLAASITERSERAMATESSERAKEGFNVPMGRENPDSDQSFATALNVEEIHIVDEMEVEHPLILDGSKEIPFTYLASLSTKWSRTKENLTSAQGKIKCFLTGVKGFQYKQRAKFELRVYVDDGSLISEILIHHNVVQKCIGHSPGEVSAALASSDRKVVSNMKETLKQFQHFLVNFEGLMVVEINEDALPVALEMHQGCPSSDAWLLLRRVKFFTTEASRHHLPLDPINLSP